MKQHLKICLTAVLLAINLGWANNQLELTAPGGGEMDMEKNLMKYYATATQPIVVRWDNYVLESAYLEYYRNQSVLNGKNRIKLTQSQPVLRVLKSGAIHLELERDFYTATQDVNMVYDSETNIYGDKLEWDQARGKVRLSGAPLITYKDWKITGAQIEGLLEQGLLTVTGGVQAVNSEISIRAGKLIFDRKLEQYTLEEQPVLIKGQSELTATEIIYNIKTKKVSAKGVVQSKMIKEKQ